MKVDTWLVKDFSNWNKDNPKDLDIKMHIIQNEDELFGWIDRAKKDSNFLISIYEIGKCVLDWS